MKSDAEGSVTLWLDRVKGGDRTTALRSLWDRYYDKLARVAGGKLRAAMKPATDADGEDAAASAFVSFLEGVDRNEFPKLDDRDDLWRLLTVIAGRKAGRQIEKHRALKRGGGAVRNEADLPPDGEDGLGPGLEGIAAPGLPPDIGAAVAEEFERLLARLDDDGLREIALWRMEGHTAPEIADRLDCSVHLVHNKLKLIRKLWAGRSQ